MRDRASYEFALASAAVALDITGGIVRAARVAVGGVAHRAVAAARRRTGAVGRHRESATLWAAAAAHAADGAKPLSDNGFKVELVKRAVQRQLATVAGLP